MLADAIQRIENEIDSEKSNPNIKIIGEFMIQYIQLNPSAAAVVCTNGKFLSGAYKAIEDYARKKPRHGNCVAVSPDEGFEQVLKYFGIEHNSHTGAVIQSKFLSEANMASSEDKTSYGAGESAEFSLDLLDLL